MTTLRKHPPIAEDEGLLHTTTGGRGAEKRLRVCRSTLYLKYEEDESHRPYREEVKTSSLVFPSRKAAFRALRRKVEKVFPIDRKEKELVYHTQICNLSSLRTIEYQATRLVPFSNSLPCLHS